MYGEIIIGPPGAGKSTYVLYKKTVLKERNPFLINLDPYNNKTTYDIDIKSSLKINNELGPHYSAKLHLQSFYKDFDFNLKDNYYLFDFPGQLEFFMCNSDLVDFVKKL